MHMKKYIFKVQNSIHTFFGHNTDMRETMYLLLCLVFALTGCTNSNEATDDGKSRVAWQRYDEAYKAKDLHRMLAVIDSMEQADIIFTAKADYLRAHAHDRAWQMRIAEQFYKKAYEALADNPAQDWEIYGDAGYRYAHFVNQRGDVEGCQAIISAILSNAEGNSDFPTIKEAYLLDLMAGCQVQLNQQDAAKRTYLKAYEIMQKAYVEGDLDPFNMSVICYNTFHFIMETGDYDEATVWLSRLEEVSHACEQYDDSMLIEEFQVHTALCKVVLLQAQGHEVEAAAIYDSIPDSHISPPNIDAAADYLMAAGRYGEAADMYARLNNTFISADSARKSFDIIKDRITPYYIALRKAGRNSDALVIADSISSAIDSALVWQKRDDATELAIIYQTHEKDLRIADLRFTVLLHRVIVGALAVILLLIGYLLWRAYIYNKVLAVKNRRLFEQIQQREQTESQQREELQTRPVEMLTQNQLLYNRLCELMKNPDVYTSPDTNHETLARLLGTNHTYIYATLRECANMTPADFINLYRIRHAALLLTKTDNPIGLIIEQSGITNRSTFNRIFREHYSMSPSEYRNAAKQA